MIGVVSNYDGRQKGEERRRKQHRTTAHGFEDKIPLKTDY